MFRRTLLVLLILCSLALSASACGTDSSPTATRTTPTPLAAPAPPPPTGFLAQLDFKFADEAEKALNDNLALRTDFVAYASWTTNNHLYVLARDTTSERLQQKLGPTAKILPVTSVSEAVLEGGRTALTLPSYMLVLERATVDVKADGTKEAARQLFARAVNQLGVQAGLVVFTVSDDLIYVVLPATFSAEQVATMTSFGKLELVATDAKTLVDNAIVGTSGSPVSSLLKLKDNTIYETLGDGGNFAKFQATNSSAGRPILNFETHGSSKLFDYTRNNIGKNLALVFDHTVITTAVIGGPIREKVQIQAPRWLTASGKNDLQSLINLLNNDPPLIFVNKDITKTNNFNIKGSFTH